MTRYTYGPLPVFSAGGAADTVIENATGGIFSATLNGAALSIYDFNDQPIASISSSPSGQAQWRVDDQLVGWVRFGSVSVRVTSNDAGDLLANTAAAVANAAAAQAAAEQALADLQAALAAGGGGVGGGLPAGTTLDAIPNGTTRLAVTQTQATKIDSLPTSFLQLGSSASTAKRGDYSPLPADIGAVANSGGVVGVLYRTAAQGLPSSVTDGLLVVIPTT